MLASTVPNVANLRHYAQIVRDAALMRRLLGATYAIQTSVLDQREGAREIVEQAEKAVLEVAHGDTKQDFRQIGRVLDDELDKLHKLSLEETTLTGTGSGFRDLDAITGGFQPGNLIVLAARPSMGKSCLVTNIAENAAIEYGKPVALFSLEMSEAELAQRFIASQARIKGDELRKGRVGEDRWPKIIKASQRLAGAPLWVDDSCDIGLLEIRAKTRRLHSQHEEGLGMVIVDYLQLLRAESRSENRSEVIGQMSRGLKLLARELEVPVIALSQLNRGVEQRQDKRPLLSDLRESGAVEQDADLVVFIYRDDYYNPEDSERPGRGRPDHLQAPQRRARDRHADLPAGISPLHELHERRAVRLATTMSVAQAIRPPGESVAARRPDRPAGHASRASANGVPSESRQIAHCSPGWTTLPPSSVTRSTDAARSATTKYGSENVSPGPIPRSWIPISAPPECVCQPLPSPVARSSSSISSSPDQKRLARRWSSAGNSISESGDVVMPRTIARPPRRLAASPPRRSPGHAAPAG